MAILKELKAYIEVNGQALTEYDDDSDEAVTPDSVTKYIAAVSGAEFVVKCGVENTSLAGCAGIVFDMYLDGQRLTNVVHKKENWNRSTWQAGVTKRVMSNSNRWCLQKFMFSELNLREEHGSTSQDDLKKLVSGLGTITVKAYRLASIASKIQFSTESGFSNPKHLEHVPEKALKGQAISQKAGHVYQVTTDLNTAVPSQPQNEVSALRLDRHAPYVTFRFKYRTLKSLKDMRIVPRSPSPLPLEDRPIESLTIDEARELLRRRNIKNESKKGIRTETAIKRERDRDPEYNDLLESAHPGKRSKPENSVKKPIEIVDLFDD